MIMLAWLKKEKVENMLQVMSIDIAAQKLKVSKWMLYKYTSFHNIDVWKCKEALKEKRNLRKKQKEIDPHYNIVYGSLSKDVLKQLQMKYSIKQLCWLFHIKEEELLVKASWWQIILNQQISQGICKNCGKEKIIYDSYCDECKHSLNNSIKLFDAQTELGLKIQHLRSQGKTYKEITSELHCAHSTVSYYCSPGVQTKALSRHKQYKKTLIGKLVKRWDSFTHPRHTNPVRKDPDWNKKFRTAASEFRNRQGMNCKKENYSYKVLLKHVGGFNTFCYLTGTPINIITDDFQLDHIIPVSKGGTNEISNCGITLPVVNRMKTDMTVPELLEMCEKILKHHNYKIEKPST